jgi:hypothetical protein
MEAIPRISSLGGVQTLLIASTVISIKLWW